MSAATAGFDAARDQTAIISVLADFFDGLYACDTEVLERVFHPAALYASASGGELLQRSMEVYLPIVGERESGASRGDVRDEQVLSIHVVAPTVAVAVVASTLAGQQYVDALTLVHLDDHWQVIAKVFHAGTTEA